jgi:CheY-like chemotaxis protein
MALILVIDDVATMRDLVRRMLERGEHSVIEAEDGEVGLSMFEDQHPVVVITDLIMPNMEGIETIQQIRRSRPDAKIIAMSGATDFSGASYLNTARKLGADAVLAKPFQRAALLDAVDQLLSTSPSSSMRQGLVSCP